MAFSNPSSPPALVGYVPAPLARGQHVLRCPLWGLPSYLQLLRRPGWHEMWVVRHYGKCLRLVFTVHPTFTCLSIQHFQFACCQLFSSHKQLHYLVIRMKVSGLLGCRVSQRISQLFNRCNVGCSSSQHSQNCTRSKLNTVKPSKLAVEVLFLCHLGSCYFFIAWFPGFDCRWLPHYCTFVPKPITLPP